MSSDGKSPEVEVLVIGAGVVGLAIARRLAANGKSVVVCEQHEHFGAETSARNSEVIQAGIYYPPNSLKAELCVAGRKALYRYCDDHGVPFRKCGKLILAGDETELRLLGEMGRNAAMLGTPTRMIGIAEVAEREPLVRCLGALESPETGIVDSNALMLQMIADLERAGGMVAYANAVQRVTRMGPNWEIELSEGTVDYTGIRPKLSQPGSAAADFKFCGPVQMGVPNQVDLFGIESPGLTASLAIADYVFQMMRQK